MKTTSKATKQRVFAKIFIRIQGENFKNGSHFAIMNSMRPERLIVRRAK